MNKVFSLFVVCSCLLAARVSYGNEEDSKEAWSVLNTLEQQWTVLACSETGADGSIDVPLNIVYYRPPYAEEDVFHLNTVSVRWPTETLIQRDRYTRVRTSATVQEYRIFRQLKMRTVHIIVTYVHRNITRLFHAELHDCNVGVISKLTFEEEPLRQPLLKSFIKSDCAGHDATWPQGLETTFKRRHVVQLVYDYLKREYLKILSHSFEKKQYCVKRNVE